MLSAKWPWRTSLHATDAKVYPGLVLGLKVLYFVFLSELQSQTLPSDGADTGSREICPWPNRCIYF